MTSLIQLRDAKPTDLPALLALEANFPTDRLSRRQFRYHLNNRKASLRIAAGHLDNTEYALLGYALVFFRQNGQQARLYSIAVSPQAQGRGIGKQLLVDVINQARQRGCRYLSLEVRIDNVTAIALYEKEGFVRLGEIPGYYQDGSNAWQMKKLLLP